MIAFTCKIEVINKGYSVYNYRILPVGDDKHETRPKVVKDENVLVF